MKILSLSEAKMKFSALVDIVNTNNDEIVVTKNGRPAAVIISSDEYESFKETSRIISDTDLMSEIKQGLKELKANRAKIYTLEEL